MSRMTVERMCVLAHTWRQGRVHDLFREGRVEISYRKLVLPVLLNLAAGPENLDHLLVTRTTSPPCKSTPSRVRTSVSAEI